MIGSWRRPITIVALAIALGGCETARDPNYAACHALGADGWTAKRATSTDGAQRVQVSGYVTVPTGGFTLALEPGPLLELNPPVQQVILRTTPPVGPATQALTRQFAGAIMPLDRRATAVVIRCGDGVLAEVPAITAAE